MNYKFFFLSYFILILAIAMGSANNSSNQDGVLLDGVTCRIKTTAEFNEEPFGYRVSWIVWDSGFRKTDLQIGDRIIGIDNLIYTREDYKRHMAVGDYLEESHWQKLNKKDGDRIILKVWREGQVLTIPGTLRGERAYYTKNTKPEQMKRRALGDNGPDYMASDGFSGSWTFWYDDFTKKCSYILDDGWDRYVSFNNEKEHKDHLAEKPRVDYYVTHHPGNFAQQLLEDWRRVEAVVQGQVRTVSEQDLEWKLLGLQRLRTVKETSLQKMQEFREQMKGDMIRPFPAVDPLVGNINAVAGKLVELPKISFRNFVSDLGKTYGIVGSRPEGYYIVNTDTAAMVAFYHAYFRYKSNITMEISEDYQFFARISNEIRMVTFQGKPVSGVLVDVVAAFAGDSQNDLQSAETRAGFFIDLRSEEIGSESQNSQARFKEKVGSGPKSLQHTYARFAGEDLLKEAPLAPLADDATPTQVMQAMIASLKLANKDYWKKLFATWGVYRQDSHPSVFIPSRYISENQLESEWQYSRKLLTDLRDTLPDVYDVRVVKESPIRTILQPDRSTGVPHVEETRVIIEHIGLFNGVYKTFKNFMVRRLWILQRVDGGSWRIVEIQHL